jgi:enoyl-CoA hydratase/carnithine racemase
MADPAPLSPPASYASHPFFTQIQIIHHPDPAGPPIIPILRLNRPEKLNAFTGRMADELIAAFNLFSRDERVRCIVLTGAGRAFCAGADLDTNTLDARNKGAGEHRDEFVSILLAVLIV